MLASKKMEVHWSFARKPVKERRTYVMLTQGWLSAEVGVDHYLTVEMMKGCIQGSVLLSLLYHRVS